MSKKIFITLLIVILGLCYCEAGSLRGRSNAYSSKRNYYGSNQQQQATAISPKEYLEKKSGFSTFGIVSIIFIMIVTCLAFYYVIMCYPLMCRDEKKYHFMDASSTITTATSSSIQSIENYPDDQKHEPITDANNSFK